jgi:nicotinate-nucleotide adenylyltransferase
MNHHAHQAGQAPPRIGLFGGTFDPVHLGHLHIARMARETMQLDQVRFIPCRVSPHKPDGKPAAFAHRMKMLELALVNLPWAVADDIESRMEEPSYSWRTADVLHRSMPEASLFWIMGGDQWTALPRWAEPERLAACVEFIVVARGVPPEPRVGFAMHPLDCTHPASATEIRRAIADGAQDHPWLDPAVAEYIVSHALYRREDG